MLRRMLFTLLALPGFAADIPKPSGVSPALLSQYVPIKSGASLTWRCLDGSKIIDWSDINNDYCDCPDGSDEPGTGACEGTTFYCANEGHIGASISSTRVNDGKCDPACCDGSDEPPGVCKNICREVGMAYRAKRDAERKIQKTGAKIRSSYISFAQKEKTRLEALISTSTREIASREVEVARLKDLADRTESLSAAALEHKKESPLYTSLIKHHLALKSLQHQHNQHLERERALGDILDALRTGYNPNYQDMAVLEAVRGWEFLAGLEHINDVRKDGGVTEDGEEEAKSEGEKEDENDDDGDDEGLFTEEELEKEIGPLLETDHISLLLEHEKHVNSPSKDSILFDLSLYIPDSFLPQYEAAKDTLLLWFQTLGIIRATDDSSTVSSRARKAYETADHSLTLAKNEKTAAEQDLVNLFDVAHFGSQGEWKKLDGTCLETNTGDYTYEVCLFDEARQKPNRGGSSFSLGKWSSWNTSPDVKPGHPDYYSKQVYKHGAQCWNGPQRSVIIIMTCGTENAIESVVELQKYSTDGKEENGREEL